MNLSEFEWVLDRSFILPGDLDLRVLRRSVDDVAVLEADLAPFREIPAVWSTDGSGLRDQALMLGYTNEENSDHFTLKRPGAAEPITIRINSVASRTLTVWRFFESLEMIQLKVAGASDKMYAQLGGSYLLPILARLSEQYPINADVQNAIHLVNDGSA